MIGPKAYIHLERLEQNISIVKNEIGDMLEEILDISEEEILAEINVIMNPFKL